MDSNVIETHENAIKAMYAESRKEEPHWYPCGSAYVTVKVRKNAKISKHLIDSGFSWWDYHKEYRLSMPRNFYISGMSQSMEYAKRCCEAYVKEWNDAGLPEAFVSTHID